MARVGAIKRDSPHEGEYTWDLSAGNEARRESGPGLSEQVVDATLVVEAEALGSEGWAKAVTDESLDALTVMGPDPAAGVEAHLYCWSASFLYL